MDAQVIKDSNGIVTEVKLPGKTLVFNVEPMVSVDGAAAVKLENNQLNGGAVKVRLPIPKDVADKYAKVVHEGDTDRYVTICTAENGDKYIEFTTTHFSAFTVSFTNELPVVEPEQPAQPSQPAASIESSTSNAAQSTPAPALKQDDFAYYTCKACGYHDWTAVDGGYKCDHCGYMESVKQIPMSRARLRLARPPRPRHRLPPRRCPPSRRRPTTCLSPRWPLLPSLPCSAWV